MNSKDAKGVNQQSYNGVLVVDNKNFTNEALDSHNRYRLMHGSNKLRLNKELCKTAQQWAERIASTSSFEHSNNTYLGQSLGNFMNLRDFFLSINA
jgi:uncharacterized protein YkwD